MSLYTLVVLETSHIQPYIFNSNRLKENVGASYLVAAATETWVFDAVRKLSSHNLNAEGAQMIFDDERRIERDDLRVEVLYSGGGNAVLLFRDPEDAKSFIRTLSRRAIKEAPGLRLTFHSTTVDWGQPLSHAVSDALKELKQARSQQPPRTGIGGLSVTTMCASTSLPATTMLRDPDGNWEGVSAEVLAKRKASEQANTMLRQIMVDLPTDYRFPLDFDDLGRTRGESSFIAVVHADGNDMGVLIQGMMHDDNREYIRLMRDFSENVKRASCDALNAMCQRLLDSIEPTEDQQGREIVGENNRLGITIKWDEDSGQYVLPFRPLVSGGDDITFVCDGRLGIDLAAQFLRAFEIATQKHLTRRLTACAGVSIVHAHYPFARAYDLADELCGSAKQARYRWKMRGYKDDEGKDYKSEDDYSLLDWHYTTGGLYDELDEMRRREYVLYTDKPLQGDCTNKADHKKQKTLYLRPVVIGEDVPLLLHDWTNLQRVALEFQKNWSENRSKAKRLMQVLRSGEAETKAFIQRYVDGKELTMPQFVDGIPAGETWVDDRCLYYDALELMDLYFPLKSYKGANDVS